MNIKYKKYKKKSKSIIDGNYIDYKNINFLKKYINESGKIISNKINGIKWKFQRKISKSIKISRYLSLLPYTDKHKINN